MKLRSLSFSFVLLLSVWALAEPARADGYFGANPDWSPSVFTYGYRGLLTGTVVGLSGGYLVARHDGFERDDWRPLVLGTGIGALSGGALGLMLGFVDLADDRPGMGSIALRDTLYGAGFGALTGAIVGGLFIIRTEEPEHIAFGAAIGTLAGAGLGLVVGFIEGRRIVESPRHRYARASHYGPTLAAAKDAAGQLVWTPALRGAF